MKRRDCPFQQGWAPHHAHPGARLVCVCPSLFPLNFAVSLSIPHLSSAWRKVLLRGGSWGKATRKAVRLFPCTLGILGEVKQSARRELRRGNAGFPSQHQHKPGSSCSSQSQSHVPGGLGRDSHCMSPCSQISARVPRCL